jgi:NAD(P)-dependent dehydrogenase (short-subunit alcohol dehydrogenase family)
MTNKKAPKVWFITGANRGFGLEIARVVMQSGDLVVATARNLDQLLAILGLETTQLLPLRVDVTDQDSIRAAITLAIKKFTKIDILVNNAGYGQLGAFEEISSQAIEEQFSTNVFGLMNVTREVLPFMRKQKSGHIFNFSSAAGLKGGNRYSVYAASKFAVVGFSESLAEELKNFGIQITCVEPGYFRTDFLDLSSLRFGTQPVEEYEGTSKKFKINLSAANRAQAGDPMKLAKAIITLAQSDNPPLHFPVGVDTLDWIEQRNFKINSDIDTWRELSMNTAFDA